MKLLILGGTRFVGRHLVAAALARNHTVTLFNRGKHSSQDFPGVETIHGDRNTDLSKLKGRRWDAIVDTSGYLPRIVRAAAEVLSGFVDTYVFVSSQSVYADLSVDGRDERAPLATLSSEQLQQANEIDASGQTSAATYGKLYGGLKVLCEEEIEKIMPSRTLIIRPGLIVGPYDYTDRFTYWVERVARGGEVLAPGRPGRSIQFIDARDLAEWIVRILKRGERGIFNANTLAERLTMGDLLQECKIAIGSDASFTWVTEDFLLREKVAPWSEMPLWLPEEAAPHLKGFMFINCEKAVNAGLTFRPLRETITDTFLWHTTESLEETLKAGIDRGKEEELLLKWHQTASPSKYSKNATSTLDL